MSCLNTWNYRTRLKTEEWNLSVSYKHTLFKTKRKTRRHCLRLLARSLWTHVSCITYAASYSLGYNHTQLVSKQLHYEKRWILHIVYLSSFIQAECGLRERNYFCEVNKPILTLLNCPSGVNKPIFPLLRFAVINRHVIGYQTNPEMFPVD